MESVLTSMNRRQLRAAVSPAGVQASLPASQSEPFCQATLVIRSSPVSSRTFEPGWGALGGGSHDLIGKIRVVVVTPAPTPGTPSTATIVSDVLSFSIK